MELYKLTNSPFNKYATLIFFNQGILVEFDMSNAKLS